MAKISFEVAQKNTVTYNEGADVKFFSLKNHGDTALVRIMHDSPDDFDIVTVHTVNDGGKFRNISCLRDPEDPISKCPLCSDEVKLKQRIYVHMIQYTKGDNGEIIATPVVWDRAHSEYGQKLFTLIDEYGPLSNHLFKIKRNGEPKSMDTTYELMYAPPTAYPNETYPIDREVFKDYTACGRVVFEKSFDELKAFTMTGRFPDKKGDASANRTTNIESGYDYDPSASPFNGASAMPWENGASTSPTRPTRRY